MMTSLQLADNIFPSLQMQDTVGKALQLMDSYRVSHLPVLSEKKFRGLVSEELLEDQDDNLLIESFAPHLIQASVKAGHHFIKAVAVYNLYQLSMVPVVNDDEELAGTLSPQALMNAAGNLSGAAESGAMMVLEMDRNRFILSEINTIIESDGATIMHLNVSPSAAVPRFIEVTIQINKKEISAIIATFEKYGYHVSFYSGENLYEDELSDNYHHLMNYLDL